MAGDWETVPLVGLLQPGQRISYGIVQPGAHERAGVPIIRVSDVRNGRVATDSPLRVSNAIEAQYRRTRLRGGELLITLVGTVGETAIVPPELAGWNLARAVAVIPVRSDIGAYWIRAALQAPQVQEFIQARLNTTVQATLNLADVARLPVAMPSAADRTAIVALLGGIDDKIELNLRMAETLEAMGRALFQSWFVDFDPVRAKADGRSTDLPEPLAGLFPSSLGEDGLPEGWQSRPLPTLARFLNGLALQKYPAQDGEPSLPVIKIAELRIGPTPKSGRASKSVPIDYHVRDGDHLFSWSGSLTHCLWTHGPGALNQHLFKVSALSDVPDWLVYQAVEHHMPEFQAIASGKAVTMGHIQRHHLDQATVTCPPSVLLRAMDATMSPLYSRSLAAALQARTLSDLRDTLLPKLISGELRIADAEQRIAAA